MNLKMTFLFTAEIVFFVLTGMYFVVGNYWIAVFSFIFAAVFAGHTGKLIAKEAVEEYKKKEEKK